MLLLLATSALAADETEARRALWDALLAEAGRGDLPGAVQRYRELARTLGAESPTQAEALYWLGHGLYELGRTDEARAALLDGIRSGRCPHCRDLLEEIELEAHSVTEVPTVWTFDGEHGLFHPFPVQDRGGIRVDHGALEWTTIAREREPDRLELGLRTTAARQVRFTIASATLDALLEVRAEDLTGVSYVSAPFEVPRGAPKRIVVALDSLVATDGRELAPSQVARVELVDRTGIRAAGANVLRLDEFEIR
jgi:hypothetical protein